MERDPPHRITRPLTGGRAVLQGRDMSPAQRPIVRALLLFSAPALLGACTMVGGPPPASTPVPRPAATAPGAIPPERASHPVGPDRSRPATGEEIALGVVDLALASIGTPYEWGGTDANGFDCSGLIQFAYGRHGIQLPRVSTEQIRAGAPVDAEPSLLRPGDVLGFSRDGSAETSHVGLYVGGDEFIHSSTSGVRVSTLRDPYWRHRLVAARRIVE